MVYEKILNKKGVTLGTWIGAIVLSAAFIVMLGVVLTSMNNDYSQNYDPSAGLGKEGQDVIDNFEELESTIDTNLQEGDVSFLESIGLSLSTSWVILKVTWSTIGTFLTGGWIESASEMAHIPSVFGGVLRMLFVLSIGFILIKLLLNRTA